MGDKFFIFILIYHKYCNQDSVF